MKASAPVQSALVVAAVVVLSAQWLPGLALAKTAIQMEALPLKAADRTVKQDLLSILRPVGKITQGNRAPLTVGIYTTPHGSSLTNLCGKDLLFLQYAPTASGHEAGREPLQPVGLTVNHWFRATGGGVAVPDRSAVSSAIWRGDCRRTESMTWFSAKDDLEAAKVVNLLSAAIEALQSGHLAAKCWDGLHETTCEKDLPRTSMGVDQISGIHERAADFGEECYDIYLNGDVGLTITAVAEPDALAPTSVRSVYWSPYITVT